MTPQAYDAREAQAVAALSPETVQAFHPVAFEAAGDPIRAPGFAGLDRFVDAMHSGTQRIFGRLGALSRDELDKVVQCAIAAADVSEAEIGVRIVPQDSLLQAVLAYRAVCSLCRPAAHIHEIGPGSGYLGVLLMLSGYRYSAFEITQGFYLWQRLLWARFGKTDHAPWWESCLTPKHADLIVANHMLNEMHADALAMLVGGCRVPLLVESYGSQIIRRKLATQKLFLDRGWQIVTMNDHVDILLPSLDERVHSLAQVEASLYAARRS